MVRLTESGDPRGAILHTTPATWAKFLRDRKESRTMAEIPTGLDWIRAAPEGEEGPGPWIEIAFGPEDLVYLRETSAPENVVTTTRKKWDAFVLGVQAGEFDHFAELDAENPTV